MAEFQIGHHAASDPVGDGLAHALAGEISITGWMEMP